MTALILLPAPDRLTQPMDRFLVTLKLRSAFGTLLRGDTLFGQFCWAIRHRLGREKLASLLERYATDAPFAIFSDAMPCGHVPRPELPPPAASYASDGGEQHKRWVKRRWIPRSALSEPLIRHWQRVGQAKQGAEDDVASELFIVALQAHNSINRMTGTTGEGAFAPFQATRLEPSGGNGSVEVEVLLDPSRLGVEELRKLLDDIGKIGFGRDASIGMGRFECTDIAPLPPGDSTATCITLAPAVFARGAIRTDSSWWRPFTRFGRHAAEAGGGNIFKTPVLMVDTGAVITREKSHLQAGWAGMGLGGGGTISQLIPETVHQGYCPVAGLKLEGWHG